MGATKYSPLTKHLQHRVPGQWATLSFGELKNILGFALPNSAWNHQAWWGNHEGNSQARGWMDAGFEVEAVNLNAGTVRFVKRGKGKDAAPREAVLVIQSSPPGKYEVVSDAACPIDIVEVRKALIQVSRMAGLPLQASDVQISWSPAPHKRPSSWPEGSQGVYCFFLGKQCLKAGKAGPKSASRFTDQHYRLQAPSTLAKSILAGKDRVVKLLKQELQEELHTTKEEQIGAWIEKHTSRLNVLIPAQAGPHVLSLVEAFLHCRLQPIFEGHG